MDTSPDKKRIATILALDMAGFSSRTEVDEQGAVAAVAALRERVGAAAAAHGGRIFNTAGDGFMLEFTAASEALLAALGLLTRAPADAPLIRIGVHVGEVAVANDGDLLGHGVNVAARLEALAQPGMAQFSRSAADLVRGELRNHLVPRGRVNLDKMDERIDVLALDPASKRSIRNPEQQFFGNINFETTFFNILIEDQIIPYEVIGDVFYRNAAKTNRTGVEVGGSFDVIGGLNLQASYTYSDFSYDEYIALIYNEDGTTREDDFSGNSAPSVPEHNAFVSLAYNHPFTQQITGFIRGSMRYVSGMYVDDANSDKTADYTILNARLGFDMKFGKFNLLINGGVNNIADKVYVGFININSTRGEYYEAGEPQSFYGGINFGYAFN